MKKFLSVLLVFAFLIASSIYIPKVLATEVSDIQPILTEVQENIDENYFSNDYQEEIVMEAPIISMSSSEKLITGLSVLLTVLGIVLIALSVIIIKRI